MLGRHPAARSTPAEVLPPAEMPSPTFTRTPEEEVFFAPAMSGEAWAQTRLGVLYVRTAGDNGRLHEGVKLLESAAAQKDPEALYELAALATAGRGMAPSATAAFDYIWRAADLGMAEAQYELAAMYAEGRGTSPDAEAAVRWGRRAAEQGHKKAAFAVGLLLANSEDPAAQKEGVEWLNKLAAEGDTAAIAALAQAYVRGEWGLAKDEAKAEALLKPPAENGNAECQFLLASLYRFGTSYELQRDFATEWLQRAATAGHQRAAEILRGEAQP
jgi:TPR repeat protein